jgi:hypothetical protein
MIPGCHNCIFDNESLTDWYGCIFGDGLDRCCCEAWIPTDAAIEEMNRVRKNWRAIYENRRKYNAQVPEEKRLCINRKFEVVR